MGDQALQRLLARAAGLGGDVRWCVADDVGLSAAEQTACTVIALRAIPIASARVKLTNACLAAKYAVT